MIYTFELASNNVEQRTNNQDRECQAFHAFKMAAIHRTRRTKTTTMDSRRKPPTLDPQSACRFFRLPPELRNNVYELVFSCPIATEVELEHAEPLAPSDRPLLCCRLFYREAVGIWRRKAVGFWSKCVFTIDVAEVQGRTSATELIMAVSQCHIRRMRKVNITAKLGEKLLDLVLDPPQHDWNCWDVSEQVRGPPPLQLHLDALMQRTHDLRCEVRGGQRKCKGFLNSSWAKHIYAESSRKHFGYIKRERELSRTETHFLDQMVHCWLREVQETCAMLEQTDVKRRDLAAILEACYEVA